ESNGKQRALDQVDRLHPRQRQTRSRHLFGLRPRKDRFPAAVHSGGGLTMATTLRRFVPTAAELIAVALVALAATLLLTSAAAYGVDVWVLWSKWDGSYASPSAPYKKVTATYKIDATYADRAACIHAIDAHLAVRGSIKPADGATWHVDTS